MLPQTAPPPALRARGEFRSQRIPFDVSEQAVEMLVGFDRKGLEATLIERSRAARLMKFVPTLRVSDRQPVHVA